MDLLLSRLRGCRLDVCVEEALPQVLIVGDGGVSVDGPARRNQRLTRHDLGDSKKRHRGNPLCCPDAGPMVRHRTFRCNDVLAMIAIA